MSGSNVRYCLRPRAGGGPDADHAARRLRVRAAFLPERDRAPVGQSPVVRHYGTGAQILRSLGIKKMRLLTNNPVRLNALSGFGIEIAGTAPVESDA